MPGRRGSTIELASIATLIEQAEGLIVRSKQRVDSIEQARIIGAGFGQEGGAFRWLTLQRGVKDFFDSSQTLWSFH